MAKKWRVTVEFLGFRYTLGGVFMGATNEDQAETVENSIRELGMGIGDFEDLARTLEECRTGASRVADGMRALSLDVLKTGYEGMGRRGEAQVYELIQRAVTEVRKLEIARRGLG
jgi:hypothetical protein